MRSIAFATSVLLAASPYSPDVFAGDAPAERALRQVLGGRPVEPVQVGPRVYLPTGRIITAIDYEDAAAPRVAGDSSLQPASGLIVGLAQHGRRLYAAWDTPHNQSGVAVYSIADPDRPQLLTEITDYTDAASRDAQGIAVANGHLYLLDSDNGIFVAPLDGSIPEFILGVEESGSWDQLQVEGDRLYTTGRDWSGQRAVEIYDLASPLQPVPLGYATLDGLANFTLALDAPRAYGFGLAFNIHDLGDPSNIQLLSSIEDGRVSYSGFVSANHAYAIGNTDVQPWLVSDPVNPEAFPPVAMDTFATDIAVPFSAGGLLVTRADRILGLDLGIAQAPQVSSSLLVKGAVDAYDIGFAGDKALLLQNTYGLHVADAHSLVPEVRSVMAIPPDLQLRAFEQMHVEGNLAFLASWGSGLFIVDVSKPATPVQIGHWEMPLVSSVDVEDGIAAVGRTSGVGGFHLLDVSNPKRPLLRGELENVHAIQIRLHGDMAFVADTERGLRVIDISDLDSPRQVGSYNADCGIGLALAISEDGTTVYLICADSGLHIIDVSNPVRPLRRGLYDFEGETAIASVAALGQRAYVGSDLGLDEVDISDPDEPARIYRHALPSVPVAIRFAPDGRMFAMTVAGGIHVFSNVDAVFANGFE